MRFLDVAAADDGAIVNASTVARDCGVSVKTVQSYYEILEDTFVALRVDAYQKSIRKRLVSHPRYYFFDMGVTNALTGELGATLGSATRGRRFEQFIVTQLKAALSYLGVQVDLRFWRTHSGWFRRCRGRNFSSGCQAWLREQRFTPNSARESALARDARVAYAGEARVCIAGGGR